MSKAQLVSPAAFIRPDSRVFIDTNILMHRGKDNRDALSHVLMNCSAGIEANKNPIVVPTKVWDELVKLSKQGGNHATAADKKKAEKATAALAYLKKAERAGFVRLDIGDKSNPYADDLFAAIFAVYGKRFSMCILTNDITLLLRIRVIAKSSPNLLIAAPITADGYLSFEPPEQLYRRGKRKLKNKEAEGDMREAAALGAALAGFKAAFLSEDKSKTRAKRT
jgi:rRNA-processing protein FCF1